METVTFCGHSEIPAVNKEKLSVEICELAEKLINIGAVTFLLGGYGDFDKLCAITLHKLKQKYPHIKSILVVPYIDKDYDTNLYDFSLYPPIEEVPRKFAILERNKWMVRKADVII